MARAKKTGAGPTSRITRRQVLQAARRYYDLGETQSAIALEMGISNSYLARLLKDAKDKGWVRVFVDADRETELAAQIQARYPNLRHVEVVQSGPTPEATARALGTVAAEWFNGVLDVDEERDEPRVWSVAIGGGMVHQELVEQVVRRPNRLSVGPTALTPSTGRMERGTAPAVARHLADRLGALLPGSRNPPPEERTGYWYETWATPPKRDLDTLRRWWDELREDPGYQAMQGFWARCDIVFVSIVSIDWVYEDVGRRLAEYGLSVDELRERGAVALMANQFIDAEGNAVPLAEGVPTYEPAMPVEMMRQVVARGGDVVLDAWGRAVGAGVAAAGVKLASVALLDEVASGCA